MDRRFHGAFTASTTAAEAIGTRGRHGWLSLVGGGYEPYLPTYLEVHNGRNSRGAEKIAWKQERDESRADICTNSYDVGECPPKCQVGKKPLTRSGFCLVDFPFN